MFAHSLLLVKSLFTEFFGASLMLCKMYGKKNNFVVGTKTFHLGKMF